MSSVSSPILQTYASEPAVHALLDACVGRLARRDGNAFELDDGTLYHIADWLRAALINNEPWLKKVDAHGRPKKLMKFGSVDAIVQEADKAMLKAAQKLRDVRLISGDEELIEMLDDGYYVVRLLTPAALDRESAEMQHCIGNGGYDEDLKDPEVAFYSLRDSSGNAHATIEILSGHLCQFQGKQNKTPVEKYQKLVIGFLQSRLRRIGELASSLGFIYDAHGVIQHVFDLPDGLEIAGSLSLYGVPITKLPERMKIKADLHFGDAAIPKLPSGLKIGGSFLAWDTCLTEIPNDMVVGNCLSIMRCSNIRELPEGLSVGRELMIIDTPISRIPTSIGDDVIVYCNAGRMTVGEFRRL